MTGNHIFLLMASLLVIALAGFGSFYTLRIRASRNLEWHGLLARLVSIDRIAIDSVAMDAINRTGARRHDPLARELDSEQVWRLLGGLEGLENLTNNSQVLLDMAAYLQRTYPESSLEAEALRLQAKEFQFHAGRLKLAAKQGSLEFHIHTYAQNSVVAYYLMERHMKSLCMSVRMDGFPSNA